MQYSPLFTFVGLYIERLQSFDASRSRRMADFYWSGIKTGVTSGTAGTPKGLELLVDTLRVRVVVLVTTLKVPQERPEVETAYTLLYSPMQKI